MADSSVFCSEYWLLWSPHELSDQPRRSSHPSRNTWGRPKRSAQQNLPCSPQIQINTGQRRSTSEISAQTDKYIKSRQLLTVLLGKTQTHTLAATKGSLNRCDHAFRRQQCRAAISQDLLYICRCREKASPSRSGLKDPYVLTGRGGLSGPACWLKPYYSAQNSSYHLAHNSKKKKKERNTSQAVETGKEMKWERDEEGEQASICFALCGLPQTHPAHESVHTVSFNLHIRFHSYFHIYLACVARTAAANNLLGLIPVSKIVVPACENTDFRCGPRQSSTWVMWRLFTAMKRRHNVI